jgi:PAS domain S-box-containing protein
MTNVQQRRTTVRVVAETLTAAAVLALVTWVAYRLQIRSGPAAVLYLSLVIFVSMRGSAVPALLVAVGATVLWDRFFAGAAVPRQERELRDVVTLVALAGIAILITRLVTSLRKSEVRWKNVFENNPTMYFMVDASGTVLAVNATGAEQLGYTVEELVGRPVLNVFLEEDKTAAQDHVARCLTQLGESMSWELRKVRKNGAMLWVRETARAVQFGTEPPVVLIACEDITEKKQADEKIRQSEARLRYQASLLDLTHDAIFVRDLDDVIIYWNRGAEQLYGWSSEEAVGRVSHEVLRTEFPQPLGEIIATVLSTGRWDGELIHRKRDGTPVLAASRWSLQRNAQGEPAGVMETNNDITRRKQAEDALRRAQSELARASTLTTMGQLVGSIAHELRQPLAAIAMNGGATLRWLNRESPDLSEAREAASRIVREAHRADEVIRRLRALLEKSELQREPFGMNDAIHEVLELAQGELRRNGVSVQTDLAPDLPPILGDRVQLQQVLLNLIVNAMEAMALVEDRPKLLVIRTGAAEVDDVSVAVEDTGPGLDPTAAPRIFDPFFTTKANGLGIGLSICRSIVEAHGGELSASPRSPHGTVFRFTVPTTVKAMTAASPA